MEQQQQLSNAEKNRIAIAKHRAKLVLKNQGSK
jgi:hypothetical protein